MRHLDRRRALMAQSGGGSTPILPDAYQQVMWIEGTGTQKLKTSIELPRGRKPTDYTAEVVFEIPSAKISYGEFVFGFNNIAGYCVFRDGNSDNVGMGGGSSIAVNPDTKITANTEWGQSSGLVVIDGNTSQRTYSTTSSGKSQFGFFYPSYVHVSTSMVCARMKLYYSKLWYSGNLVSECVPCYRKSDGKIGVYDLVTEKFYTNYDTETFNKGPNVN